MGGNRLKERLFLAFVAFLLFCPASAYAEPRVLGGTIDPKQIAYNNELERTNYLLKNLVKGRRFPANPQELITEIEGIFRGRSVDFEITEKNTDNNIRCGFAFAGNYYNVLKSLADFREMKYLMRISHLLLGADGHDTVKGSMYITSVALAPENNFTLEEVPILPEHTFAMDEVRALSGNDREDFRKKMNENYEEKSKASSLVGFASVELPAVEFMALLENTVPVKLKICNLEIRPESILMEGSAVDGDSVLSFIANLNGANNIVSHVDAPVTAKSVLGTKTITNFQIKCNIARFVGEDGKVNFVQPASSLAAASEASGKRPMALPASLIDIAPGAEAQEENAEPPNVKIVAIMVTDADRVALINLNGQSDIMVRQGARFHNNEARITAIDAKGLTYIWKRKSYRVDL
jgi:hypothetical protein